jgi:hypothetical protein
MNYFNETMGIESANTDIMEFLLMREQFCDFEDSLSNYFMDDKKAALSDVNYLNDCGFVEAVAQF